MRRRSVLALGGSALSIAVTGCLGGSGSSPETAPTARPLAEREPPDVDCSNVSRPIPPRQPDENTVQPVDYPGEPPSPLEDSAVDYVTRFEEAYRRNYEILEKGPLREYSGGVTETWTYDAPPGGAVVRLKTVYGGQVLDDDGPGAIYDSPQVFVTYYVDPSRVVRAETKGQSQLTPESLDPDPWENGDGLTCFA